MSDLAKVDDVIEHGQHIPANVVQLVDAEGDTWTRWPIEPDTFRCDRGPVKVEEMRETKRWWPMTVVEVDPEPCDECESTGQNCWVHGGRKRSWGEPAGARDADGFLRLKGTATGDNQLDPEPQPAERKLIGPPHAHQDAPCTDACYEPAGRIWCNAHGAFESQCETWLNVDPESRPAKPVEISQHCNGCGNYMSPPDVHKATCPTRAESGPLVLTLPQVPDGAVALIGVKTGLRYEDDGTGAYQWRDVAHRTCTSLAVVLERETEGVTVEFAPPPEPRIWERLDPAPSEVQQFQGASGTVYRRWAANSAYFFPPPGPQARATFKDAKLLSHWREVDGPLTEVISNG